jgi:hypothetical protein
MTPEEIKLAQIERSWAERDMLLDRGEMRRRLMRELLRKQESLCFYCKRIIEPNHLNARHRATFDHFLPLCRGGPDTPENLVAACHKCNQLKSGSIWEEGCLRPRNSNRRVYREAQRLLSEPERGDGPGEPCWTGEIESDGRHRYSQSQCVNAELVEVDRRAARGEFPLRQGD